MLPVRRLTFAFGLSLISAGFAASAGAADVVASIPPVHSIVAGVMGETGSPHLLVPGGQSPHSYSLKPSDARALDGADLVVWVGPDMETFLHDTIETLADDAKIVTWAKVPGVTVLPTRAGGVWAEHHHDHGEEHDDHDHDHEDADEHDHEHEHADEHDHEHEDADEHDHDHEHADEDHDHEHEHVHGDHDMHLWLSPANAIALSKAVAEALAEIDPANADVYRANDAAQAARIAETDKAIAARVAPVKGAPFVVFHDAYHYFEDHYGLAAVGSVTVSPDVPPGAARLRELRHLLEERGAVCIFAEPQFEPKVIDTIAENTDTKVAVLDPLGADIAPGADLYPSLLESIAASLTGCLSAD